MVVGAATTLSATPRDASGNMLSGRAITWSSGNASIASVAEGVVTGVAPGAATITAASEGQSGSAVVTVTAAPVVRVDVAAGGQQLGLPGRALADSLVARAVTAAGAPVAGAAVTWVATGGTLSAASTTTGSDGAARVQWTVATGDAVATASVAGATGAQFRSTGRAPGACQLAPTAATQRFSLGPTDFTLSLRSTAPLRVVALFADFPGTPATEPTASLMAGIVTPGLQLLQEMSYGRLSIAVTPVDRWYRMSQPIGTYDWRTFLGHRAYLQEVMRLADPDVNFAQFDAVYVLVPPSTAQPVSPTFNGGQGSGLVLDGRVYGNGVTFGNDARSFGASILAHETGHMLGLVDLYAYAPAGGAPYQGNQFRFVGAWSTMSNVFVPAHFLAWEKRKLGFFDPGQVDCLEVGSGEEIVIDPVENAAGIKMVAMPISASRALVLEVRALQGLDAGLCAKGVLLYEVDAAVASGEGAAVLRGSRVTTSGTAFTRCGPWADATYDLGAGNVSRFTDAAIGVDIQLLGVDAAGRYRIRIRR